MLPEQTARQRIGMKGGRLPAASAAVHGPRGPRMQPRLLVLPPDAAEALLLPTAKVTELTIREAQGSRTWKVYYHGSYNERIIYGGWARVVRHPCPWTTPDPRGTVAPSRSSERA